MFVLYVNSPVPEITRSLVRVPFGCKFSRGDAHSPTSGDATPVGVASEQAVAIDKKARHKADMTGRIRIPPVGFWVTFSHHSENTNSSPPQLVHRAMSGKVVPRSRTS